MQLAQSISNLLLGLGLVVVSGWGVSDIRNTKHNLTQVKPELSSQQKEKEICVFCHTPTASVVTEGGDKPVIPSWQKAITQGHSFVTYDDIGRAGSLDAEETVGSQSVACLSCHDATQAFGVSNMLSLDHPFGVPYRGSTLRRPASLDKEPLEDELAQPGMFKFSKRVLYDDFRPLSSGKVGQRRVWWVSSENPNNTRRGKNDLPLYVRPGDELDTFGNVLPRIECSSCHDPHTENDLFLRVAVQSGRLCLTCHDK